MGLPWRWGANTTASGERWVDVAGQRRTQINARSPALTAGSAEVRPFLTEMERLEGWSCRIQ